jgi:hypothetical protein
LCQIYTQRGKEFEKNTQRRKNMSELKVGHTLFVEQANNYFVITDIREFEYILSKSLTASQKVTTQELTELKSPSDEIYCIEEIGLENHVKLWMKFRGRDLFGVKAAGYLDIETAPVESPWEINLWAYLYSPYYDLEDQLGAAVTAKVHFLGKVYSIQELDKSNVGKTWTTVHG